MKLPVFATVLKTPVLTFCLFLFACFFFLLITPNITKPTDAYAGTMQPVADSDWSGQNVTFHWSPAVDIPGVVLIITDQDDPLHPAVYNSADHGINLQGRSSLTVNTADWNIAVHPPDGRFRVVLVWTLAEVSNGRTFTIPVPSSWSLTAGTPDGTKVTFTCGGCPNANVEIFVLGPDPDTTVRGQSGSMASTDKWDWNYGAASGTYTANLVAYGYSVVATTKVTITASPSPTPPPGTGCGAVGTGQYVLGNSPAISGNNVTFTITSGSLSVPIDPGQNVILHVIHNPDTGVVAGTDSPTSGSSVNWTAPGPGDYCAALVYITTQISNAVPFTIGDAAGDTCTSLTGPSLFHIGNNKVFCHYISTGKYDSFPFTFGQLQGTINALSMDIVGRDLNDPSTDGVAALANTSLLASSGQMVASLYSAPPVSGVQYFAQKIHDLNPVTPAYAAAGGIGYQTLGPVQKIWIAFRNIAYVGFIVVFVIMGFMIMFRAHISPQAVATVQDSIPRLVIALILVTFSYAIAGFMIDIMFLTLNIVIQALVSAKLITGADYLFKDSVFGVIWGSWRDTFSVVYKALSSVISDSISLPWGLDNIIGPVLGSVGGAIGSLIIAFALIFIMFRIFFMLLMAYVMIILLTMFAPFFFLIQALPGNNGAKEWFRQMASNVAVFPTVALMFLFAGILGGIGKLAPGASAAIQPDKIGQFPLIVGNLNAQAIGELIGIGFLLITPSAADIVKNAFGSKGQGGAFGAAAPAMAAMGASAGFLGRRASQSSVGRAISDAAEISGQQRAATLANLIPAPFRGGQQIEPQAPTIRGRLRKD